MQIWKRTQNFGKKFGNLEKLEIWKNKQEFRKILEILKIFRYLEIFGNYLEIWTIENEEKEIWK